MLLPRIPQVLLAHQPSTTVMWMVVCLFFILSLHLPVLVASIYIPSSLNATYSTPSYFFYVANPSQTFSACPSACSTADSRAFPAAILNFDQNQAATSRLIAAGGDVAYLGGSRNMSNMSVFRWQYGPFGKEAGGLGRGFYFGTQHTSGTCALFCHWDASQPDMVGGGMRYTTLQQNGYWDDQFESSVIITGCMCQIMVNSTHTASFSKETSASRSVSMPSSQSRSASATDERSRTRSTSPSDEWSATRSSSVLSTPSHTQIATPSDSHSAALSRSDSVSVSDEATKSETITPPPTPTRTFTTTADQSRSLSGDVSLSRTATRTKRSKSGSLSSGQSLSRSASSSIPQTVSATDVQSTSRTTSVSLSSTSSLSAIRSLSESPTRSLTPSPGTPTAESSLSSTETQTLTLSTSLSQSVSLTETFVWSEKLRMETKSLSLSATIQDVYILEQNTSITALQLSGGGGPPSADAATVNSVPPMLLNGAASYDVMDGVLMGSVLSPFANRSLNCLAHIVGTLDPSSVFPTGTAPVSGKRSYAAANASAEALLTFLRATTVVSVSGTRGVRVFLQRDSAIYRNLVSVTVNVSVGLSGRCLARADLFQVFATFVVNAYPDPNNPSQSTLSDATQNVGTALTVVSPVSAVQASRNSLGFSILNCMIDTGNLDFVRSPTSLVLGSSSVGAYIGGAIMNHVLVIAIAALQGLVIGVNVAFLKRPLFKAVGAARFPSLLIFPLMILLEATATCAIVTILYGEQYSYIGYISLFLCSTYPIVILVYLACTFSAVFDRATPHGRTILELLVHGDGLWIDGDSPGYCRRNRLLFDEYRAGRQLFLVVEIVLAVLLGGLEGVKLGYGECDNVLIAVTVALGLYVLLLLVFRPCAGILQNIVYTVLGGLQFVGCVLLCFPEDETRYDWSTKCMTAGSYIIMAKAFVDVLCAVLFLFRGLKALWMRQRARQAEILAMWSQLDDVGSYPVPPHLLSIPVSTLARTACQKLKTDPGELRPAVVEELILLLQEDGPQDVSLDSALTLERITVNTDPMITLMKRRAGEKYGIDGVFRDWREETLPMPLELLALRLVLRAKADLMELRVDKGGYESPAVKEVDPMNVEVEVEHSNLRRRRGISAVEMKEVQFVTPHSLL